MPGKKHRAGDLRQTVSGVTALVLLSLSLAAHAAELPPLVVPEGVGINIHFSSGHEKDLDLIAAAGVKVVRADFHWDQIEQYKGIYDWRAFDELAANLHKRGLRPLFILSFSNALYEDSVRKLWQNTWVYYETNSPQNPRSVAAFAQWAAEAAKHFRKYGVIWEIWNEPNLQNFWKPAPDVAAYSQLAIATCNAIHNADHDATVVAPAASTIPWDFLEAFFKTGALNCLDGVSVHPYRAKIPETVSDDYPRLRALVDRYTPPGRSVIPILSGEWGYSTERYGVPLQDQADFAVRMQLVNLLNGIPLSVWYDWKNDGTDSSNNEHNYGIVTADLAPKFSYDTLKTFTTQLGGYQLVRRLELGSAKDYALLFSNKAGQSKLVAWTTAYAHDSRIPAPMAIAATKMTLIDGFGLRSSIQPDHNAIPLRLSNSPVYIEP